MSPNFWWEHFLCEPEITHPGEVVIRDVFGKIFFQINDRLSALTTDDRTLNAIERGIAYCDHALADRQPQETRSL
jgi:hypothetical protein